MATDNTQQGAPTDNSRVGPTPGPWAAHDVRYNRDYRTCVNVMTEDGLRFIAAVSCDPSTDSVQLHANARLIAAAPELLEALEELCAKLDTISGEPFINPPDSMWGRARAAIAKARGQS